MKNVVRDRARRAKKLVLTRASASDILASLQVTTLEKRRARAVLAAVSPLDAARAASRRHAVKKASLKAASKTSASTK